MKTILGMLTLTYIKTRFNGYRATAAIIFGCLLTLNSIAQQNCTNCGVIVRQDRIFRPELNTYVVPRYENDAKIFFYDSMIISERYRIVINEDAKGKEISRVKVIGYTFKDYRQKTFTNYPSFSATACNFYFRDETIEDLQNDAKRFFNVKAKQYEHTLSIPDTIMHSNKYSRMLRFDIEDGDTTVIDTIYYVPEAQSPLAYMNKLEINNKRYSVIRMDYFHVVKGIKGFSTINVVSNNLTREELKVFAAWKKNAAKTKLKKKEKKAKHK